jgi:hypothetical protein
LTDQTQSSDQELLTELRKVGTDLVFRKKTRKLMRIIFALTAFSVVISVISIFALVSVRTLQVRECQRDNEFRKAYVDQWAPILADSPAPQKPAEDAPQEVQAAYERSVRSRASFVKSLDTNFAQHAC